MIEKFCSQCGTPLSTKFEGGRERPACAACGHVVFGHFSIGVGGLLMHGGRLLLIQRGEEPGKGVWTIPGGYVEADESPDVAVVREVEEETGLQTRVTGLIALRHRSGEHRHNAYLVFGLELAGPLNDLKHDGNGSEIERAALLLPDEFDTLGKMGTISRWIIDHYHPQDGALFRLPDEEQPYFRTGNRRGVVFGPKK